MANNYTLGITLSANGTGGAALPQASITNAQITMAGDDLASFTQDIGTAAELLAVPGDVGPALGVLLIKNRGANTVKIYIDSGATQLISEAAPGLPVAVYGLQAIPYLKATGASSRIQCWTGDY